jgi:hypothetical protein
LIALDLTAQKHNLYRLAESRSAPLDYELPDAPMVPMPNF